MAYPFYKYENSHKHNKNDLQLTWRLYSPLWIIIYEATWMYIRPSASFILSWITFSKNISVVYVALFAYLNYWPVLTGLFLCYIFPSVSLYWLGLYFHTQTYKLSNDSCFYIYISLPLLLALDHESLRRKNLSLSLFSVHININLWAFNTY